MPAAMTTDELQASWHSVRAVEAMIQTNTAPTLYSLVPHVTSFAQVPESLLLVFATSVLEAALLHLRDAGRFRCERSELGSLMKASKEALGWQDYPSIDRVRLRRNGVAHRAELLDRGECTNALEAIARELIAWGILENDTRTVHTVSFKPDA
jgi:hypothetical protein